MGYTSKFEDVLLSGWEPWDNGTSVLPGKNTLLQDGTKGCILIGENQAVVYSIPLDSVNAEENVGSYYVDSSESVETMDELHHVLSQKDIDETKVVFQRYFERERSYK